MQFHHLELEGFASFKEQQSIDFDELGEQGVFVITGRTGVGKSTIFDAITFALFGSVPRYPGSKADGGIRSDYLVDSAQPTRVRLEFSHHHRRFIVERTAEYTKPGNKNPTPSNAELVEIVDGKEEVLAARRLREVNTLIQSIVGFNPEQFQQVILLAQGAFQEFLVADSQDRRTLLRKLFNTRRFDDYQTHLHEMERDLASTLAASRAALETSIATLATTLDEPTPALEALEASVVEQWLSPLEVTWQERLKLARSSETATRDALAAAGEALEAARETRRRQERREQARATLESLLKQSASMETLQRRVQQADRAAQLHEIINAENTLRARVADLEKEQQVQWEGYAAIVGGQAVAAAKLHTVVEKLSHQHAVLTTALSQESQLESLKQELEDKSSQLAAARAQEGEHQALRDKLIQERPDFAALIAAQELLAAQLPTAVAEVGQAEILANAASRQVEVQQQLSEAITAEQQARAAFDAADDQYVALRTRQLAEYASELARELQPGTACAVCGSLEHPQPASQPEDAVTAAQVDAAENAAAAARKLLDQRSTATTQLQQQLEGLRSDAAGLDVVAARERVEEAKAARDKAQLAVDTIATLREDHSSYEARLNQLNTELATIEKDRVQLTAQLEAAQERHRELAAAVTQARGAHPSVEAHRAVVEQQLQLARELWKRHLEIDRAQAALVQAEEAVTQALATSEFADATAVAQAQLAPTELEQLREQYETYQTRLAQTRGILGQDELQGLPEKLVELAQLEQQHGQAKETHNEALRELGRVQNIAATLSSSAQAIRQELADSARQLERYQQVSRLALSVRGQSPNLMKMSLETFALAAELEEIVIQANLLLAQMTNGRYELRHTDERTKGAGQSGLGLEVVDAYNGEARSPRSLSGGEKFQASLALALGLAEVVTHRNAGVRLDTLLIDEGFGALDEHTLDDVLTTIDSLRAGGRVVGLISHVEAVKERIPHHLHVEQVQPQGWSQIRSNLSA